jgi:hypothetical protein
LLHLVGILSTVHCLICYWRNAMRYLTQPCPLTFLLNKKTLFMPVIWKARYENNVKLDPANHVCKALLIVFWTHGSWWSTEWPNHLDSFVSSTLINGIISYPLRIFFIFCSLNTNIAIYAALSIRWTLQGNTKIKVWLQEGAIAPLRVKVIFIYIGFFKVVSYWLKFISRRFECINAFINFIRIRPCLEPLELIVSKLTNC